MSWTVISFLLMKHRAIACAPSPNAVSFAIGSSFTEQRRSAALPTGLPQACTQLIVVFNAVQRAYMELTPLLAIQGLAALVAIIASSYVPRIIKSFLLLQRIKQYPGKSHPGSVSTAHTVILCRLSLCHKGSAVASCA